MPPMRVASTFAGIEGFGLGFERAGMTITSQVEIDDACRDVLARHFPQAWRGDDIATVRGADLGNPDLVAGGFPCQDTSTAAPRRAGLAGQRSGMFYEFARLLHDHLRLVDETGARWVVIENPVGLLTSPGMVDGQDRRGWDMAAVVRGLEDLGYGWAYRVVDARHVGSAQRRQRVIVVGHRGGDPRPAAQVLGLTDASSEAPDPSPVSRRPRRPAAVVDPVGDSGVLIWRKSARARKSIAAGGYETWVPEGPDGSSNTLTGFDYGNALRQTHLIAQDGMLRTLTLREWERLQGFPDDWTRYAPDGREVSDGERGRMLGNAMNVHMAEWLGRRLVAVDAALPMLRIA